MRHASSRRSRHPATPAVARTVALVLAATAWSCSGGTGEAPPPNVVVILTDDQGWGDVGAFGATDIPTPNLDRLAREGVRLTEFYAAPTCTPARAMLMTGSYAPRVSVPHAYFPWDRRGLHPDEVTIAEVLRDAGYATGIVGKWHLGHHPEFLPTRQGFDEYFGIPYSNDMGRVNPLDLDIYPDLPLLEGEEAIELEPDQSTLTRRYTERAVSFIERHRDEPFFLYVAHSMPHWPIYASAEFEGRSPRGVYGDVIAEIDWSTGEIARALAENGLDERTLLLFTSDNGPWLLFGREAGSSGGLREGKGTTFEGGVRVPAIARWPGRIPAGTASAAPLALVDVLPTVARLASAALPEDRTLDGRDAWPVLAGESGESGEALERTLLFHHLGGLEAVRRGRWKLHLPHSYGSVVETGVTETRTIGLALYDLAQDPSESRDVAAENPAVVADLLEVAEQARADLGDTLTGRTGSGTRAEGVLP